MKKIIVLVAPALIALLVWIRKQKKGSDAR